MRLNLKGASRLIYGNMSLDNVAGLAASSNAAGVALGGIAGHAICTAAAVIGGRQLARYINERTILVSWFKPNPRTHSSYFALSSTPVGIENLFNPILARL